MTLYDFVRHTLNDRNWTVPYFAKQVGVSKQLAYKWLAEEPDERIRPSSSSCQKIARALGVDADFLLQLGGHRAPSGVDTPLDDPDLAAVSAAWPRLDDVRRKAIRILANTGEPPLAHRSSPLEAVFNAGPAAAA